MEFVRGVLKLVLRDLVWHDNEQSHQIETEQEKGDDSDIFEGAEISPNYFQPRRWADGPICDTLPGSSTAQKNTKKAGCGYQKRMKEKKRLGLVDYILTEHLMLICTLLFQ